MRDLFERFRWLAVVLMMWGIVLVVSAISFILVMLPVVLLWEFGVELSNEQVIGVLCGWCTIWVLAYIFDQQYNYL